MPALSVLVTGAALSAGTAPHLEAVRADVPPVVDGKLDDAVWQRAKPDDRFTQKVPLDGAPPSEKTTVRVLYDDEALYVAFDCEQVHTPVVERLTRRDRIVESDSVSFDLGTRRDRKSAFEFWMNASGVIADAVRFNDTDYSSDWDENWEASTARTTRGWSAEFKIPMRILRFASLPVQSWDFQARRYISERQETDEWSYHPRSVAGEVSLYGYLDGLAGLHAGTPFEVRPFVLARVRRRDAASGQLANGTDVIGSAGADVKWHPSQDLTFDGTFNPDFAQVEADQVVLNLTTYETYYPEKRPFFLEGIDTFSTPFQLLYTRRIGRVGATPTLRSSAPFGEQLVDVPEPATIYGASKLTGRIADKWTVGTLQAVTARNDVQVQLANGARVTRLVDPTSSFNVVRLKRDVGENGHIGLIGTMATHAEPTTEYPPLPSGGGVQQLCPTGNNLAVSARCFNDAYVGGVDWRWRSSGGAWTTGGQLIGSTLQRGPARAVPDGTIVRPGDLGWGATSWAAKEGGEHWVGNVNVGAQSKKLDYNDLGYDQRANNYGAGAGVEYRELSPTGPFLEMHVNPNFGFTNSLDGLNLGRNVYLNSFGKLTNFWSYYTDLHYRSLRFDDRELGDGTALEREGRVGHEIYLATDPTRRVAFGFDQITDRVFDGWSFQGSARMTLRVLPQWDFDLLPNWLFTWGEPRYVSAGTLPGQQLFGTQDARSVGVTFRTTYTFAPRLTLQGYAQLFLASGHYADFTQWTGAPGSVVRLSDLVPLGAPPATNPDFEQGALNVNLVLRWEYTLGSTLFIVYTRAQTPSITLGPTDVGTLDFASVRRAPAADAIFLKLSYWWGG